MEELQNFLSNAPENATVNFEEYGVHVYTVKELSKATGWSHKKTKCALQELMKDGLIIRTDNKKYGVGYGYVINPFMGEESVELVKEFFNV